MPVRYKLETRGFSDYLEKLVEAGQDIDLVTDEALEAGGDILLESMERRVPRDKGDLAANLERSEPVQDGNFHYIEVGLSKNAPAEVARYGGAQEFGWGPDHPGQPYVRPAIDEDMKRARSKMREIFKKFLGGK